MDKIYLFISLIIECSMVFGYRNENLEYSKNVPPFKLVFRQLRSSWNILGVVHKSHEHCNYLLKNKHVQHRAKMFMFLWYCKKYIQVFSNYISSLIFLELDFVYKKLQNIVTYVICSYAQKVVYTRIDNKDTSNSLSPFN